MRYKYVVDGVEYSTTEEIRTKADLDKFSVGGTIDILYSCDKIYYSKYVNSDK